jgi:hypothetical protein
MDKQIKVSQQLYYMIQQLIKVLEKRSWHKQEFGLFVQLFNFNTGSVSMKKIDYEVHIYSFCNSLMKFILQYIYCTYQK